MMTPIKLLIQLAGLSNREASKVLNIRPDTVNSWSSGRNPAPAGAIEEMRVLVDEIDIAADEAVKQIQMMSQRANIKEMEVELGYCLDHKEAHDLGWPAVGAHNAMLARVIHQAPDAVKIKIVPRGSTPPTAAAMQAHKK